MSEHENIATLQPMVARRAELDTRDLETCRAILREGSKSFAAASLLLPTRVRLPAAAVYAFCRVADDAVDLAEDPEAGLAALRDRLDRIYQGRPDDDPVDRAFAVVVEHFAIPQQVPLALLEGFAWDVQGRRYQTIDELEAYCARVASTVGVMMTLLMGPDEPEVLARACDLGLAMQLTNICRDVGEDARAGRIYLPLDWLAEEGVDSQAFLDQPTFTPQLGRVIKRVLDVADGYYQRADLGISMLPRSSRIAIRAARLIYSDIGREIRRNNCDSVSTRAYTSKARKLWLLIRALPATLWRRRECMDPPQAATRFLLQAAAAPTLSGVESP